MSVEKVHKKLKEIRTRKDLTLKANPYLRETFLHFGEEKAFELRYYQIQMVLHLIAMKRFLIGDDTGLGKTVMAISALTCIWNQDPNVSVIVLTTKSSAPQWRDEILKFTIGVSPILYRGTPKQRMKIRDEFNDQIGPKVLISNYHLMVRDFTHFQNENGYILITDEATVYNNPKTQIHQVIGHLANNSSRMWAATATMIENNLTEGYGIFRILVPGLFPDSPSKFMFYFCIVEMMNIPRSSRKIPRIVGYTANKINEFRQIIDPYYLGRPKHEVDKELPVLISKTIEVSMTREQDRKYAEALAGTLCVGGEGEGEEKEISKLTAVTYCQEIVNHLNLIGCPGESSKLDTLLDLLTEGDLSESNVIVFSRFKKMVDIAIPALEKRGIFPVRITGDENETQRNEAQSKFQNPKDPTRILFITQAGGESLNLQAAKAIVFFDTPWSGGKLLQILGRMLRIGSLQSNCYAIHLVSTRYHTKKGKKTIDHRVLEVNKKKINLIEAVLGKRIKEDGNIVDMYSNLSQIFNGLQEDAKEMIQ